MSELSFFVFAALLISSAVSAVTITDLRKAALAFFLLNLVLASFFLIEGSGILALVQFLLGVTVSVFLLSKFSDSEKSTGVSMVRSPNGMIGLFILICFTMIVTPVWMYSIWSFQPGDAPAELSQALIELAVGDYALTIVSVLLMLALVVISLWKKPFSAPKVSSSQERRERVS